MPLLHRGSTARTLFAPYSIGLRQALRPVANEKTINVNVACDNGTIAL